MIDTSYKRLSGLYMKDIKYWALNESSGEHVNSKEFLDMAMSITQCDLRIKLGQSELREKCLMISQNLLWRFVSDSEQFSAPQMPRYIAL